jgi:hypothetical protein
MDTATFLASVVAPGAFFAICYKGPGKPMGQRFFPRASTQEAASFIRWCDGKGMDVWFSPASFKLAEAKGHDPLGNPKYKGERTHLNVDRLQCFWYDADIKRDGDGKDPSRVFASLNDVKAWVASLTLPQPNLAIRSGYGVHLYWLIDHAYSRVEWQTRAEWVKAMLVAHNAPGDVNLTTDASRILRPPNTRNHKVVDQPVPVTVLWDTLTPAANYGTD